MLDDSFGPDEPVFNRHIFSRSRPGERRRSSAFGDWGSPARSGRKRPRPRNPLNEDEDTPMTVTSRRGIKIGDSDAVWSFYEQRFKNCQQTACKLIAKAWVKAVEPKKQSTHPYTGSDEKAPDWWPKPWGPTKDDKVRHKEPDHLYKRGITKPYNWHRTLQPANIPQNAFICSPTSSELSWSPTPSSTPTFESLVLMLPSSKRRLPKPSRLSSWTTPATPARSPT